MPGRFEHLEFRDQDPRQPSQQIGTGKAIVTGEECFRFAQEQERFGRWEPALQVYTRCLELSRGMIAAWAGQVQMLVQLGEQAEARLWSDKALEVFINNGELLACKAQACARLGELGIAQACSDGSISSPGSSAWRWQVRGEVLLAKDQMNPAAQCFAKSLAEKDTDWYDRVRIAGIYLYYRKPAAALDLARQAVESMASAPLAWYVQGQCQRRLGMASTAFASFNRCLEIKPDFAKARQALLELASRGYWARFCDWLRIRR